MELLQRLKFGLSNYKKLVKIEIEFNLITKSGNKISMVSEEIKITKSMIVNCLKLNVVEEIQIHKQIHEDYKKIIQKRANTILKEYQIKKIKILNAGVLESGDYIVKCLGNVCPYFESLNYKEYRRYLLK